MLGLACALTALCMVPWGGLPGLFCFEGDISLRRAPVPGALRYRRSRPGHGLQLRGHGASREMQFAVPAELAQILGLAALAQATGHLFPGPEMLARIDMLR